MRKIWYYLLYILVVGLVLAAVIFGLVAWRHHTHKPKTTAGKSISQSAPKIADSGKTNKSTTQKTTPSTPTPAPTTAPNTAQLSNTGPGEVVGLFVAVVIMGTLSFSFYQRKTV